MHSESRGEDCLQGLRLWPVAPNAEGMSSPAPTGWVGGSVQVGKPTDHCGHLGIQPPWLCLPGPSSPPILTPDLTFAEVAVPGKARGAGTAVGAGSVEAVSSRAAPMLLEGAFIQVCRRWDPESPGCVH